MSEKHNQLDARLIMDKHDLGLISAFQVNKTKSQNEKAMDLLSAYCHKMGLYVVKIQVSLLKDATQEFRESDMTYLFLANFSSSRNESLSEMLVKAAIKFNQNKFFIKRPSVSSSLMKKSEQGIYLSQPIGSDSSWLPNPPNLERAISLVSGANANLKMIKVIIAPDHIMGKWALYLRLKQEWADYNDFS